MLILHQFAYRLQTLAVEFNYSVTSWFRSKARNKDVGGNAESFHLSGLGADCVLDSADDKPAFMKRARRLGLDAIDEGDHIHLEPSG